MVGGRFLNYRTAQVPFGHLRLSKRAAESIAGITRSSLRDVESKEAKLGHTLGPRLTMQLFYATDFADRLKRIMPALRAGFIVPDGSLSSPRDAVHASWYVAGRRPFHDSNPFTGSSSQWFLMASCFYLRARMPTIVQPRLLMSGRKFIFVEIGN